MGVVLSCLFLLSVSSSLIPTVFHSSQPSSFLSSSIISLDPSNPTIKASASILPTYLQLTRAPHIPDTTHHAPRTTQPLTNHHTTTPHSYLSPILHAPKKIYPPSPPASMPPQPQQNLMNLDDRPPPRSSREARAAARAAKNGTAGSSSSHYRRGGLSPDADLDEYAHFSGPEDREPRSPPSDIALQDAILAQAQQVCPGLRDPFRVPLRVLLRVPLRVPHVSPPPPIRHR